MTDLTQTASEDVPTDGEVRGGAAPAPRVLSRKGRQTRSRLLAAAKEIFEEDGFLGARISDIAERAGLSHGSFYTYFDSKEEVFREVALAVEDELGSPVGEVILAPGSTAPPYERIRVAMRKHLETYRREARIMGVIEQVSRHDAELRSALWERRALYGTRRVRLDPPAAACAVWPTTDSTPRWRRPSSAR